MKGKTMQNKELYLELNDTQWELIGNTHDREITRAIVVDDEKNYYFVRAIRNDSFGNATIIETAGGGVEKGEDLNEAIKRELLEELGATVEIICKIGIVSDYYNLINRHNINNYYLCKAKSFGKTHMTNEEIEDFHLSTLKLSYDQALAEYEKCSCTRLGRLIANREVPILKRAKELLDS
jgi:8-oxo-dGTP pyrophosphatase MutT (NUDIX family)